MEEKSKFFPKLNAKNLLLGLQHLFAMFGATVLVPAATGLNPSVALFTAGLGTIAFHLITKKKVPVFLGSSFAFVAALQTIIKSQGIPAAQGGIIMAGAIYLVLSLMCYILGVDTIKKLFPPVVTGPVIIVIGLSLSGFAISLASAQWVIALLVLFTAIIVSIFFKGFFKLVPTLIGMSVGYIATIIYDLCIAAPDARFIDFSKIASAPWVSPFWNFTDGSFFTIPQFSWSAIVMIAPIALVTFMEHVGDITTNGAVVGKDFLKDPGLHRTLLGDGLATMIAGVFGGPPNTTYSENTGVLAVTKIYDPALLRLTAVFAVFLGLFGKFGAVLQTLPDPVLGGVCILLYGMISAVGIRTLAEANLDFSNSRNLIIVAVILVLGLGLSNGIAIGSLTLSGNFVAVLAGVLLNAILPANE
ncbi:uracil-xanthine permease family protein [Acidaminobacterium chupaoyuni]